MITRPARPMPDSTPSPIASPCIGVCRIDAHGLCIGCRRSLDEIARWSRMDNAERLRIMRDQLPQRRVKVP